MTDPVFHEAYETVRARYTSESWAALTPRQIANEIYREIRSIDAGRAATAERMAL